MVRYFIEQRQKLVYLIKTGILYLLLMGFSFTGKGQLVSGPNNPSSNTTINADNSNWSNTASSYSSDNIYCGITNNRFDTNDNSDLLILTGFGFSIPSSAILLGIEVEIERFSSQGSCRDQSIRLINSSSVQVGDNKASATNWAGTDPDSYVSYGGASDLWNAGLGISDINSANFGVVLQVRALAGNTRPNIDHVRITIYYDSFSPGGTGGNLKLWLTSSKGVLNSGIAATDGQSVNAWQDISGARSNDASDSQLASPTYRDNLSDNLNFHPVVEFDGIDDGLDYDGDFLFSSGTGSEDGLTVFFVAKPDPSSSKIRQFIIDCGYYGNAGYGVFYGSSHHGMYTGNFNGGLKSGAIAHSNDTLASLGRVSIDFNNQQTFNVNGALTSSITNSITLGALTATEVYISSTHDVTAGPLTIGRQSKSDNVAGDGGRLFDGKFAELLVYAQDLTTADILKIESYLAIKFGITKDNAGGGDAGDYFATDGTVLWDASNNPGYHNDIIAIGRDDSEELLQKQSRTQDDSLIVYISSLATNNNANSGAISNDISYLVIGNNKGMLRGIDTETPGGITTRFEREWKITNTNFSGSFNLEIEWHNVGPFDIGDIRLLVDDDGDFSNATVLSNADGLTISEGSIIVEGISNTHIPMNSTRYFTIGSVTLDTPLPIELVDFTTMVRDNNIVDLHWRTASEINSDFYQIERSANGNEWKSIDKVKAAGNSNELLNYHYQDKDPLNGISYYRLKNVDFDGSFEFSFVISAYVNNNSSNSILVYPNPTNGMITITQLNYNLNSVSLYNQQGIEVTDLVQVTYSNGTTAQIDITSLNPGIYFIKLHDRTVKLIKN